LNFFDEDEDEEGYSSQRGFATRLPLLPLYIGDLDKQPLNFVAFTPGTSFHLHSGGGLAKERVLLYHLLREEWEFGCSKEHISILGPEPQGVALPAQKIRL